ncbi:MAG: hypothetical protein Q7U78_06280 [Gallionella sp.]|nr:hypothetical protein [Gallionella sp.]
MSNVENLILEHMRGMRADQERIEHELREIKNRITSLEGDVAGIVAQRQLHGL